MEECPFKEATIRKYWHQNKQELFSTCTEKVRSASTTKATIIIAAGKEGFKLIQEWAFFLVGADWLIQDCRPLSERFQFKPGSPLCTFNVHFGHQ